jgi:hypothetical protein
MRSPLAFAAALAAFAWVAPASADLTVFEAPKVADFKLDLYGWVQPRFTWQQSDDRPQVNFQPNPAFVVQRARLGTIGAFGPWARAQIEVDFSGEFAVPIDAFVTLSPIHEKVASLNFTFGQFRVPISRQNLLPSVGLQFADLAYFVAPNFLVDRNIGGKIWSDLFAGRVRLEIAMFNANDPGRGQKLNSSPYFLYAARVEISPLGPAPRFEGDLRPLGAQHRPVVTVAASAMKSRFDDKHFYRNYVGADLAAYWEGASLYGEFFYHYDDPIAVTDPTTMMPAKGQRVVQMGFNVQAGYFPPLPWVREHLEPVVRVEYFDPNIDVKTPTNDSGERDLTGANPTWGYLGYVVGLNYYLNHRHTAKAQLSYEIRNETKQCLKGQMLPNCTGYIANNLLVAQVTAGF